MANHTYLKLEERWIDDEYHVGYTIHDSLGEANRFDWHDWESFFADLPSPRAIWKDALFHDDFGGADMLTDEHGHLLMDEENPQVPAGTDSTGSYCYHYENTVA